MNDHYDEQKEKNTLRNEELLDGFEKWLRSSGLSDKTIKEHVMNAEFYIDVYLTYYEVEPAEQGVYLIDAFFSTWFLRKAMWSSEYSVKQNIVSLRKFYEYMVSVELVEPDDYETLCDEIKDKKPIWTKLARGEYDLDNARLDASDPMGFETYDESVEENREILHELLTYIKQFRQLNAWEWLSHVNIFGIQIYDQDDIVFCSVTGQEQDGYGIRLYKGAEGLESLRSWVQESHDYEEESALLQKCTTIVYEDRKDIEEEDYELIRISDVKFRGKKQWPVISLHEPGFSCEVLDLTDADTLEELAQVMKTLPEYVMDLKSHMEKASLFSQGKCTVKIIDDEEEEVLEEYVLDVDEFLKESDAVKSMEPMYHDIDIQKVKKHCQKSNQVWTFDVFHSTSSVEEDSEIFYPLILLIVDQNMNVPVTIGFEHPKGILLFQKSLLKMMEKCGFMPRKMIRLRHRNASIFDDLAKRLGIDMEIADHIECLAKEKEKVLEHIDNMY